jgi:hypothetical protein
MAKARHAREQDAVIAVRGYVDEARFWQRHALDWLRNAATILLLVGVGAALGCAPLQSDINPAQGGAA